MAELIYQYNNHTKDVNCVAFSCNSDILASVSGDKKISLWNVRTGTALEYSPLQGHTYSVVCCAFSPSKPILATGSQDCLVMLWNTESGRKIRTLRGHNGIVRCCSFSWNSQYLSTASSDFSVQIWSLETYNIVKALRGPEFSIQTCCFSPDDKYIVSGSVYGDIRIWDIEDANCEDMFEAHDKGASGVGTTGCAFSPQYGSADNALMNNNGDVFRYLLASCGGDNLVRLWKIYATTSYSQKCRFEEHLTLDDHTGHVWACRFSSNGQVLVSCSSDKTIILWNTNDASVITKLSEHTRYISTVAISPDCQYLASGSNDKTVHLWSLAKLELPVTDAELYEPVPDPPINPIRLLRSWTLEEVLNWLQELGLPQYTDVFRSYSIDGMELVQMNDAILAGGLGIGTYADRRKIMRELKTIKEQEPVVDEYNY